MHAPISHQTSNFLLEIPQHAGGSGQLSMEVCSCHNYDVTDVSIPTPSSKHFQLCKESVCGTMGFIIFPLVTD